MIKNYSNSVKYSISSDFIIQNLNNIELETARNEFTEKYYTFLYIMRGDGVLQIDFDDHIAIKSKVFFIEKLNHWRWVKIYNLSGFMVQFTDLFYNYIYTGNPKIKSYQSLIGDIPPFIKIGQEDESEWLNVFELLNKEYRKLRENSREIICLTLKILVLMYRRNTLSEVELWGGDHKKQLLNEFRKLVNNRFVALRTAKDYARKLNISPNYLNALCKEIYFKTVSEIIQERVILEAKRLLTHTVLNVSEISYKLGFKDNSYFGRYFRKAVGVSPEKYRTAFHNTTAI